MVELTGVTKRFGRIEVLRKVDVVIRRGRVTGLVGPNAAGKSTLIKAILGLVRPEEGFLTVDGLRLGGGSDYRRRIGYMPQSARFPENLTGNEVLHLLRDLRREERSPDEELLRLFALGGELHKPIRTLSGGTRQKLNAAIAFLFHPDLLILDEPTAGLDPLASGVLKDKLWRAREAGVTVILASHTMSELEELADDIVFLLEGQVRFQGPTRRLVELTGLARLERAIASLMASGGAS